jgi:hypothetical protein
MNGAIQSRRVGCEMFVRVAAVMAALGVISPALSGELTPEEARHFVAGKLFSYTCFEGTTGAGRIHPDGSVVGTIQIRGTGPVRHVALPSGTIQVSSNSICASVRGMFFQPCFNVNQTSARSFRGSIAGLGFAYCDFVRRNPRLELASDERGSRPSHAALALRPSRE